MNRYSSTPDREATFASLFEECYSDLLRFVQRRAGPDHAEDVVAEAFLVAWRRLDDLPRSTDDARAWLYGVARHVLLNLRRGTDRQRALGVRLAQSAREQERSSDDPAIDLVIGQTDLVRAWRRLSEVHQEALALAAFEGLQAPQAAAVLGISAVAFRLRLSRARRALHLQLRHLPEPAAPRACIAERTTS